MIVSRWPNFYCNPKELSLEENLITHKMLLLYHFNPYILKRLNPQMKVALFWIFFPRWSNSDWTFRRRLKEYSLKMINFLHAFITTTCWPTRNGTHKKRQTAFNLIHQVYAAAYPRAKVRLELNHFCSANLQFLLHRLKLVDQFLRVKQITWQRDWTGSRTQPRTRLAQAASKQCVDARLRSYSTMATSSGTFLRRFYKSISNFQRAFGWTKQMFFCVLE